MPGRAVRVRTLRRQGVTGRTGRRRDVRGGPVRRGGLRRGHVRRGRWRASSAVGDGGPLVGPRARPVDRRGLPRRAGGAAGDSRTRTTSGPRWWTPSRSRRRFFRDEAHLDEALAGFGDAADLKTPVLPGAFAGSRARWPGPHRPRVAGVDPALAYRAGLVHDLGRVAVPTGIWERPGPLRPEEWELVRLHPYHSGRILARSPRAAAAWRRS